MGNVISRCADEVSNVFRNCRSNKSEDDRKLRRNLDRSHPEDSRGSVHEEKYQQAEEGFQEHDSATASDNKGLLACPTLQVEDERSLPECDQSGDQCHSPVSHGGTDCREEIWQEPKITKEAIIQMYKICKPPETAMRDVNDDSASGIHFHKVDDKKSFFSTESRMNTDDSQGKSTETNCITLQNAIKRTQFFSDFVCDNSAMQPKQTRDAVSKSWPTPPQNTVYPKRGEDEAFDSLPLQSEKAEKMDNWPVQPRKARDIAAQSWPMQLKTGNRIDTTLFSGGDYVPCNTGVCHPSNQDKEVNHTAGGQIDARNLGLKVKQMIVQTNVTSTEVKTENTYWKQSQEREKQPMGQTQCSKDSFTQTVEVVSFNAKTGTNVESAKPMDQKENLSYAESSSGKTGHSEAARENNDKPKVAETGVANENQTPASANTGSAGNSVSVCSYTVVGQSGGEEQVPDRVRKLEQRQEKVLEELQKLQHSLQSLSKQRGVDLAAAASSSSVCASAVAAVASPLQNGRLHELVISADPSNVPLSLLVLLKQLSGQFQVLTSTFVHSSATDTPEKLRNFLQNGNLNGNRSSYQLALTVIWKKASGGPRLMVSPTRQTYIDGEANIARYLARLLQPAYDSGSITTATQMDEVLDLVQQQLLLGNNKERAAVLRSLNARLGKNQWLVGSNLSLADVVAWSAVHGAKLASETPANVKRWLKACADSDLFQEAVKFLSS